MWRQLAVILTLSAGATMAQFDKIDVGSKISDKDIGVKAPSPVQACNCQCHHYKYMDAVGTIQGNCNAADSTGGRWCYVKNRSGDCDDIQFSTTRVDRSGRPRKWSYQACATPPKRECCTLNRSAQGCGSLIIDSELSLDRNKDSLIFSRDRNRVGVQRFMANIFRQPSQPRQPRQFGNLGQIFGNIPNMNNNNGQGPLAGIIRGVGDSLSGAVNTLSQGGSISDVVSSALDQVGGTAGVNALIQGVGEVINGGGNSGDSGDSSDYGDYGDYDEGGDGGNSGGGGGSLFGGSNPGASTAGQSGGSSGGSSGGGGSGGSLFGGNNPGASTADNDDSEDYSSVPAINIRSRSNIGNNADRVNFG